MTTETYNVSQLLAQTEEAINGLVQLMSTLNDDQVNKVPYKDSWTPGQLFRHVSKSLNGMKRAMEMKAKPANRDPEEFVPRLKEAFTDYSVKLKSPEFIIPEEGPYEKDAIMAELKQAFEKFKTSVGNATLTESPEGLPLGPVTKLEIVHFTVFHTERHLHQMKKICDALKQE